MQEKEIEQTTTEIVEEIPEATVATTEEKVQKEEVAKVEQVKEEVKAPVSREFVPRKDFQRNRDFKRPEQKKSDFIDQVVSINRVTKVTKGGRQFRFSATVVVGNKKGQVGLGTGKASEAPEAVKKAVQDAQKNLITVPIVHGTTIPHEAIGVSGAGKVMIKPALKGTGVKAGGPVRAVLELSGIRDILSKSLGSNTKINVVHATFNALRQLRTVEQIAELRGKTKEEILGYEVK